MKVRIDENAIKSELKRRKGLVRNIIVFFMVMIGSLYFATLNIPNAWTHIIIVVVEGLCFGALWTNRFGRSYLAGTFVVGICETGLMAVILTTRPFDSVNLPLLDLFVMAITLSVSLLPARFAFLVAFVNTLFIFYVVLYQPHTQSLDMWLTVHGYNAFIRPVALQWICVVISYLWVQSTNKLIAKVYDLQIELALAKQQLEKHATQASVIDALQIDASEGKE